MTWTHWALCAQVFGRLKFCRSGKWHVDGGRDNGSMGSDRIHNSTKRVVCVGGARVLVAHGEEHIEAPVIWPVLPKSKAAGVHSRRSAAASTQRLKSPRARGLFRRRVTRFRSYKFRCVEQWHSFCISLVLKAAVRLAVHNHNQIITITRTSNIFTRKQLLDQSHRLIHELEPFVFWLNFCEALLHNPVYSTNIMQSNVHMWWLMIIGAWTVWEVAHIACIYAKATEPLQLRHRQDLYSAKVVGEFHVPVLQSIKAGSVSVRRLDCKT